ncbi:NAD(P)H-binding protein [Halorarius litoreus]|uniref:NAD(P)H-binding protein n=1 Tax=Halorarius litoreus TaxID=2962676 RepID=UPI0020CE0307|nr:NAD(P)H-binding protein [Halorarius litoreus]
MKVLVTGGTGFVGTALCEELAARGHEVTALARNPHEGTFEGEVETVRGDVTDYDSIEPHFEGQDAVVQLVALSPLFQPKGGNQRHFEVHLGGTENAVKAAKEHGVGTFLQMSGVHASPDAETAYLKSKGEAEDVVTDSGLDWIIFRPTVLFGDGDEIRSFVKTVATPYLTPLPGGGKQRFQLMWVDDCARLMAGALEGKTGAALGEDAEEEVDEKVDEELEAEEDAEADEETDEEADADADDESDDTEEPAPAEPGENPHVGQIYEVGGPEVQKFSEVVELIYAAEHKPVSVIPVPMALADIGLSVLGAVGGPLGPDQAKSLRKDLVVQHNDIDAFGVDPEELTTFADYLGVDESELDGR